MIRVAICDDDLEHREYIVNIIKGIPESNIDIDTFEDGIFLLQRIQHEKLMYDIIFLDMEMSHLSGIETAKIIRQFHQNIIIIFVTGFEIYAKEAYDVHPFHFLSKPVKKQKLLTVFHQAYGIVTAYQQYFSYGKKKEIHRVALRDILYFESQNRSILIHTRDGQLHSYYDRLSHVEESLANSNGLFYRIHQSIIVNRRYISKLERTNVTLLNGENLPVSAKYWNNVYDMYMKEISCNLCVDGDF